MNQYGSVLVTFCYLINCGIPDGMPSSPRTRHLVHTRIGKCGGDNKLNSRTQLLSSPLIICDTLHVLCDCVNMLSVYRTIPSFASPPLFFAFRCLATLALSNILVGLSSHCLLLCFFYNKYRVL